MGADFYDTLAELVADAIRERPADASLAEMVAALAVQLGNVIALAAGGDPKLVETLLTGCEALVAENAADTSRVFRSFLTEDRA